VGTAAQRAAAHRAGIHAKSACKLVKPQDAQLRVPTSRAACCFALPPGQAADGSEGRRPLRAWPAAPPAGLKAVILDRACEGDETRRLILD
jgi:hypothetical protein